jgi:hypothetical protein
MHFVVLVKLKL